MSKKKILVIPSDGGGVGKFRSVDPHVKLQELYGDYYHIDISNNFNFTNTEKLKSYDIIHIHKVPYNNFMLAEPVINVIKDLGITLIIDIDDYWNVPSQHPQYYNYQTNNYPPLIVKTIQKADYVTTTTSILADEIKKLNKNVVVIPNALDVGEKQNKIVKTESEFDLRFGWLGGSSHLNDLMKASSLFDRMDQLGNVQMVLCGFDLAGKKVVRDKVTDERKEIDMSPEETAWYKYEMIVTNKHRKLTPKLIKKLSEYDETYQNPQDPYRRIWTKPVTSYLTGYNEFDVSLIPLVEHDFNKYKSQLKVIEAGFFKKAIIAQDFGPYTIDIIDGKNGLLVDSRKNHKDWYKKANFLLQNPNMVTDLGESLYETVVEKYELTKVTELRHNFYQSIK